MVQVRGTSHMFLTGPDVIRQVMREEVTMEALGGADTHASKSGNAHGVFVGTPPPPPPPCCRLSVVQHCGLVGSCLLSAPKLAAAQVLASLDLCMGAVRAGRRGADFVLGRDQAADITMPHDSNIKVLLCLLCW